MNTRIGPIGVLAGLVLVCAGCWGPMMNTARPFPERLGEETQSRIDEAWEHFHANQADVARETVLDAILAHQLQFGGVDSVYVKSVKYCQGGTVEMESWFDRLDESRDVFQVTLTDSSGEKLRVETFTRADVDAVFALARTPETRERLVGENGIVVETDEEYEARQAQVDELYRRAERVKAAFPLREKVDADDLVDPLASSEFIRGERRDRK